MKKKTESNDQGSLNISMMRALCIYFTFLKEIMFMQLHSFCAHLWMSLPYTPLEHSFHIQLKRPLKKVLAVVL